LGSEDSLAGAHLNVARTVCRRAERSLVRLIRQSGRTDLGMALKYMNRLSDLLFIMTKNG
jgi:cob(I)alamin adenosyltransferase